LTCVVVLKTLWHYRASVWSLAIFQLLIAREGFHITLYASLFRQKQAVKNKQTRKKTSKNKYIVKEINTIPLWWHYAYIFFVFICMYVFLCYHLFWWIKIYIFIYYGN